MRMARLLTVFSCSILVGGAVQAADDATSFAIGDGHYSFTVPDGWVRKQPKVRIIEHEFAAPAAEGDKEDARFTVMGAGGAIEDNITRWMGQFDQPDGKETKDVTKKEKKTVAGADVYVVDITGTYKDSAGGPFAGGKVVERPDYRMLAAIIVTEKDGNYFLKLYGPKKTMAANEAGFQKMVTGLQKK